jgi:transcriptional regulator with XRE-family HTH domain
MDFDGLRRRLIELVRIRLRNGELSERRLARLTGISQPHVHNVLKGERILSLQSTDRILKGLNLTVADLIGQGEGESLPPSSRSQYQEVPVLEGWLGPGLPVPNVVSKVDRLPFPGAHLSSMTNAVMARLAPDPQMAGLFQVNDLVLLDQSPTRRMNPDKDSLYVISRRGEGVIRRLRLGRAGLLLLVSAAEDPAGRLEALPLEGCHLLDVIKARVAWLGRFL